MKNRQIYNPYLPSWEYIPDGEPHVFGNRLYLYGSHDRFDGKGFCLNDYVCYSADVMDLTEWRYEGIIYKKEQDPRNAGLLGDDLHAMWAPDVALGPDGRYYLYYCLDFLPEVAVAVSDSPAGKYEFLGLVRYADGTPLGQKDTDYIQFDPGVFMDDDGQIYLYSGNGPMRPELYDGKHASQVMTLENDMLTMKTNPRVLLPSIMEGRGTGFEDHEFFEASSIRKIKEKYYFVYSSVVSHELCYAVSDHPDRDYQYGGTIVDIGDVNLNGRSSRDALNPLGNTHGGIECANGQWYVFYHRQTNRTNYSRQGCAEKIYFDENGKIGQAEVTSCGLNPDPLTGRGVYPANICCRLQSVNGAVFSSPGSMKMEYPYLTQDIEDLEPETGGMRNDEKEPVQYIANIQRGAVIGYKYFAFSDTKNINIEVRGEAEGEILLMAELEGTCCGKVNIRIHGEQWQMVQGSLTMPEGVHPLYLKYHGSGKLDFRRFEIR